MLRIARDYAAAATIDITLPQELRYDRWHHSYGAGCFITQRLTDRTVDLGGPPKDGKLDPLGNRPVIHSNVNGTITYGTEIERSGNKPNDYSLRLRVPAGKYGDLASASCMYQAAPPPLVSGSFSISPEFDHHFAYCRIYGSFGGTAEVITCTVTIDVGPYTDPVTGDVVQSNSPTMHLKVRRNSSWYDEDRVVALCGSVNDSFSEAVARLRGAFAGYQLGTFPVGFERDVIGGFSTSIAAVQIAHSLIASHRLYVGDTESISKAFDSMRVASFNGLAFAHDTKKLLRDTSRLIHDIKSVRRHPKKLANVWLSYRYGHRLYYQDCQELMRGAKRVKREKPLKFHGRHRETFSVLSGTTTTIDSHCELYVSPHCTTDLNFEALLRDLDFWPSAENLWDLVPYSFVCDWFVDITSICKRYDMRQDILRYPILGALVSVKITTSLDSQRNSGCMQSTVTYYARQVLTPLLLSTTLARASLSLAQGLSLIHAADALALAVSRR